MSVPVSPATLPVAVYDKDGNLKQQTTASRETSEFVWRIAEPLRMEPGDRLYMPALAPAFVKGQQAAPALLPMALPPQWLPLCGPHQIPYQEGAHMGDEEKDQQDQPAEETTTVSTPAGTEVETSTPAPEPDEGPEADDDEEGEDAA